MVIKAKRIYEPKKEDNFDIQKVLWEAIQKSISSSTDQTKQLVSEFERMSSDAGVKKLEEKFYQYIKNLRIEKEEIKQDIYKSIENWVNEIGRRVENHEHKEYLTQEDKDECINSARDMVNEAVLKFDNLFKPFLEQLNTKSNKEHTHIEFEELKKEIEENEEELEQAIEMKADKEHKHEIEDVTWLSTTLKDFAKKDHKHDEYATREELDFINRRRSGWGWAHVIQENWVVANQRGNLNFIGATVTDDPQNNATVVTVVWWGGWWAWIWAPVAYNPTAWEVISGTATLTLVYNTTVGIVTVNWLVLNDTEYSQSGYTLTVTPVNGFDDTTDEILVFQYTVVVPINNIQNLTLQNFYVDTIIGLQVTEAHREDWTTVVNTYNGSNKLQTAVYTFPDTSTLTLTITYDIDGNLSTALYS